MKHQYFLIQALIVLSFGLISCNSDTGSGLPHQEDRIMVEIQNQDETIQKIRNTKKLRASSRISIGADTGTVPFDDIKTKTTCKTTFKQEILFKETLIHKTTIIPVKDILPSEVFAPSNDNERKVNCDLEIQIFQGPTVKARIILANVNILHTDTLTNHDLGFLRKGEENFIQLSHLRKQTTELPAVSGEVETLCESGVGRNFFSEKVMSMSDFFADHLFVDKNFQACRLLFRSPTNEVWLSDDFFVQSQEASLTYNLDQDFLGTPQIEQGNAEVLDFAILNNGNANAYFKITLPKANLNLTPIYSAGIQNKFFQIHPRGLRSSWKIIGADKVQSSKNSNNSIYRLRPGQEVSVRLTVDDSVVCPKNLMDSGIVGTDGQPVCKPGTNVPLQGYQYKISSFPAIQLSHFDDYTTRQWRKINLLPKGNKKIGNDFVFWQSNQKITSICKGAKKIVPKIKKYPVFKRMGLIPKCH